MDNNRPFFDIYNTSGPPSTLTLMLCEEENFIRTKNIQCNVTLAWTLNMTSFDPAWYKTWQTRDNRLSFASRNIYMISLHIKINVLCFVHPHKQILCQSFCPLGLYPRWSETFYGTRVAQYFSLLYDCFCCCLQKHSVLNACCIVIKEPHQAKEKG